MSEEKIVAILEPIALGELPSKAAALESEFGKGLLIRQHNHKMVVLTPGDHSPLACPCGTCDDIVRREVFALDGDELALLQRFMILCEHCGNKRCPHATFHGNDCTGSNEPGQEGSAYA